MVGRDSEPLGLCLLDLYRLRVTVFAVVYFSMSSTLSSSSRVLQQVGETFTVDVNILWILIGAYLVFFMQVNFPLLKNLAKDDCISVVLQCWKLVQFAQKTQITFF